MDILTSWLRSYLPALPVDDAQLAEDLTLRGIAVEGQFPASSGNGARYEMDITTNRVDAMNHYGVAREVAAIYNLPLATIPATAAVEATHSGEAYPVKIEATDACGRFTARILRGVTVKPATGLVADNFAALGEKPISGPVDVTNFGWLAIGQPTHVFDLDKLEGSIIVRYAKPGERIKLLDGSEHTLVAEDLVVADEKKSLALAGVMGGWDSRVTEETKNILVEAAWFLPAAIRASSRRHGLHTDASHRFERGADLNAAPLANNLVTRLVIEQAGGQVVGPMTDVQVPALVAQTADRAPIQIHVSEVNRHLGTTMNGFELDPDTVSRYLSALGCQISSVVQEVPTAEGYKELPIWSVKLPSWRLDLEREIDLIEEVARVHGYNKFANTLPTFTGTVIELPHATQESVVRETLRSLGYTEAVSSTFCSAEDAATFTSASAVAMGNPLSAEAGMLRPVLTPGIVTMLAHNLHRDVATARLFELGTTFTGSTASVTERAGLALGLTGSTQATALYKAEDALFYEAKGALEAVLAKFAGMIAFDTNELPTWIAPGRGARILLEGTPVAVFGELNANDLQRRKLRQPVVLAEVAAATLLSSPLRQPLVREISRYQAVERDFSFIFPDTVLWQAIDTAIRALSISELQAVTPVEIFRDPKGKAVAAGSYSLLVRVVFQSSERTLSEEDLTSNSSRITAALAALGGAQRA
jgi:phenylalanyl-tRNA synthetase beta chain